ncbi:MAG TPA: DNA mismatch repair endonuclease MutL [Planctomycetota bacterium]|nr:DNA mismatch repair endonuclease MutL [Planctomycetota bacterium]
MATVLSGSALPRIRELPPDLVDKIAAGEVVERPSSVVKELVENAVDAGAKRIAIVLEEGGRKLIRVTDDGHGIEPEQLLLAVKSHATSKLKAAEDLFAIQTLGFRGEALASIASVSQFRIASCARGARDGAELRVEGAVPAEVVPCGHPKGTSVEARSLFFNVPARRAFLKGARAELRHVEQEVERLALARFDLDLVLEHEGRTVLRAPPTDEPRERIAQIFSTELAESLVAVGPRGGRGVRLRGYASPLDRSRNDARQQLFFLNGRAVRDKVFLGALRAAYANLLPPRRQPSVFLWLDVPPDEVDVNVHPTKAEVRFLKASDVFALLQAALREAILSAGAAPPPLTLPRTPLPVVSQQEPGAPGALPPRSGGREGVGGSLAAPASVPDSPAMAPRGSGRFFQLHRRYIVEETERGFRLVDPHALHERLLYDQILARFASGGPLESQRLLFPLILEADRSELALLDERKPVLEALGFEIAGFGPTSLALHAAPRLVPPSALPELVREILGEPRPGEVPDEPGLDQAMARVGGTGARRLLHQVAAALACKAAVKFGASLSDPEIEALLRRRDEARAACCPHGRPTALAITLDELDRRFGR